MPPTSRLNHALTASAPSNEETWRQAVVALSEESVQLPAPLGENERRPVVVLGAGSIVRDGHGPAYSLMGLRRLGIYDRQPPAAHSMAQQFGFEVCCESLQHAVALGEQHGAVYDLALPPEAILEVLPNLPRGSGVLIQKPLGKTLEEANRIVRVAAERELTAGVNFQLPFSPQICAAFHALDQGLVGALRAARVELDLKTEWSLWEFLLREPRIEILLHSIHYLSMFGHFFGQPDWVESTQRGDPSHPIFKHRDICSATRIGFALSESQTSVEPECRSRATFVCSIDCNHLSTRPRAEWRSELVLEGTEGTIVAKIADNLDYPNGVDDALRVTHHRYGVQEVELLGNRFPLAFVATMTLLQRALAEGRPPTNDLELGLLAMRLAESCYLSNDNGGRAVAVSDA